MAVLGIISHELGPLGVFFGVLWHQFGAMRRRQFSFTQTDTGPEPNTVQGLVVDWWRASRHAAAFLGGARDCGFWPRRNAKPRSNLWYRLRTRQTGDFLRLTPRQSKRQRLARCPGRRSGGLQNGGHRRRYQRTGFALPVEILGRLLGAHCGAPRAVERQLVKSIGHRQYVLARSPLLHAAVITRLV